MATGSIQPVDITSFLEFSKQTTQSRVQSATDIAGLYETISGVLGEQASASVTKAAEEGRLKAKQEQEVIAATKAAGADTFAKATATANSANEEVMGALNNLHSLQTKTHSNPIDWLKTNLLEIPEAEKGLERAATKASLLQHTVDKAYQNITKAGQVALTTQESTSATLQQANATIAATAAKVAAYEAKINGLRYNSDAQLIAQTASRDVLGAIYQNGSFNLQLRQDQRATNAEARAAEAFKLETALRQEALAQKGTQQAVDEEGLRVYNQGLAVGSLPPVDLEGYRRAKEAFAQKVNPGFLSIYKAGSAAAQGSVQYFDGFSGLADYLEANPGAKLTGKAARLEELLAKARNNIDRKLSSDPNFVGLADEKKKSSYKSGKLDEEMNKLILGELSRPSDSSSISYMGPLNSYVESPTIRNTPIYGKLIKPLIDQGQQVLPENLMPLVMSGVKNKTITTGEAADLATIMQAAYATHMAQIGIAAVGYKPPPGTMKYEVDSGITYSAMMGTAQFSLGNKVNLFDPTSITAAVARAQVLEARKPKPQQIGK